MNCPYCLTIINAKGTYKQTLKLRKHLESCPKAPNLPYNGKLDLASISLEEALNGYSKKINFGVSKK